MGRRKFDSRGKVRRKAHREEDASWRLTHLLTASHLMAKDVPALSRFFMRTSSQIGRRINMTMDCMTLKRHVCKKCHTLLIPDGPTPCRVRISPRRETHVVVTCGNCGFFRRYLARTFDPTLEAEKKKRRESDNKTKENVQRENDDGGGENKKGGTNKKRKLDTKLNFSGQENERGEDNGKISKKMRNENRTDVVKTKMDTSVSPRTPGRLEQVCCLQ